VRRPKKNLAEKWDQCGSKTTQTPGQNDVGRYQKAKRVNNKESIRHAAECGLRCGRRLRVRRSELAQCQTAAGTGESTAERSPPLCHHRLLARRDPQAERRDGRTCNAGGTFEQATHTPVAEFFFLKTRHGSSTSCSRKSSATVRARLTFASGTSRPVRHAG
jgi:hypothetical protein